MYSSSYHWDYLSDLSKWSQVWGGLNSDANGLLSGVVQEFLRLGSSSGMCDWGGLITKVVPLLRWSHYWGCPITGVVPLLRWSHYWSGPITEVVSLLRWSYYWGGPITEMVSFLRWSHYWSSPISEVVPLLRWSHYWGRPIALGIHCTSMWCVCIVSRQCY